jgi:DNA-directed RNA polymerase subunit RPC12/RpoP
MKSSENPQNASASGSTVCPQGTEITRSPPAGRKFPCAKCGARLDFDPSSHALQCPYCGFKEAIAPAADHVRERDWDEFWANSAGAETIVEGRHCQVTCSVCGAVVLLEEKVAADKCPYCGNFIENQPETAQSLIPPTGLLPFKLTEHQARLAFSQWLAGRWFAPNSLKQFANLGQLAGTYAPYWTYDSMTFTSYTGERGDDYFETESYQERDANGQMVTKTRQVRKTRWTYVSGEVRHFFDDVLIYSSRSLPENYVAGLAPWDLLEAEDFRSDFLSGFQMERYTIGLKDGFERARALMDQEIRRLCCRRIGGDHQRLTTVDTQYMGITFKHLLLPMWLAVYRYQTQTHRVLVNGRSGKVVGSRPYSWIKISLFAAAVVAAALLAWLLFNAMSGSS